MSVLEIKSDRARGETAIMAAIALAVLGGVAVYALSLGKEQGLPELTEWQVSAFDGLSLVDQSIHSALGPAMDEAVVEYNDSGEWPAVDKLAEDLISPFYRDTFWEANGRVEWELIRPAKSDTGSIYYFGRYGQAEGQSAYLGMIRHIHRSVSYANQLDVWIHTDPDVEPPSALNAETLVSLGWRQVLAYSGTTEVSRIRGN